MTRVETDEQVVGVALSFNINFENNDELNQELNNRLNSFINVAKEKFAENGTDIVKSYIVKESDSIKESDIIEIDNETKIDQSHVEVYDEEDNGLSGVLNLIFTLSNECSNPDSIFMDISEEIEGDFYATFYDIEEWKQAQYEEGEYASGISEADADGIVRQAIDHFL